MHVFNPATEQVLQTIPDPDSQAGSAFGGAIVPLGDINDDGFLDFAAAAENFSGSGSTGTVSQGRVYVLSSDDSSPPQPQPQPQPGPAPGQPGPAPLPTQPMAPAQDEIFPAKLEIERARILRRDRRLSVLAPITARASGEVEVELFAAQRRLRFNDDIDAENRRIRFLQPIPREQAELGTGIVTITYPGDADTRPQEVRLRAASQPADLELERPVIEDGRLTTEGTISDRARGVVRLQLQYVVDGETRTLPLRGEIDDGEWSIDEELSEEVQGEIARRSGTVHSYTLFTGFFERRIRGEMQSFQVLGAP